MPGVLDVRELIARITTTFGMTERPTWAEDVPRVLAEMAAARTTSVQELDRLLAVDTAALKDLAGRLTVNETFFLRHPEQFAYLAQLLEAWRITAAPGEELRVWSAGCASGEEPYSIAIIAAEVLGRADAARVKIVATDLSAHAVERAREARYTAWSFRGVPPWLLARYITQEGRQCVLDPEIRSRVELRCASLAEALDTQPPGHYGVVFFRNVAIYLDAAYVQSTYDRLARALGRPGVLFVSPSDPPPAPGVLHRVADVPGAYRVGAPAPARLGAPTSPSASPAPRLAFPARPVVRAQRHARAPVAPPSVTRPPPEAQRVARAASPPPGDHGLRDAVDANDLARAVAIARRLAVVAPADADAQVVLGKLLVAADEPAGAVEALRRAVYLAPGDHEARYWYATALLASGDGGGALRQLRTLDRDLGASGASLDAEAVDLLSAARFLMAGLR